MCSYVGRAHAAGLARFEVSPPDLIESELQEHYRILEKNDYGIVAASAAAQVKERAKKPTVGATTVVIDKGTGEGSA